jgi:hypothetical protein
MQIKIALKFHLTPVKIAIIKGNNNNTCQRGCGKTGTLRTWLVGMQVNATTMESSMEIPQKTKDRTAI